MQCDIKPDNKMITAKGRNLVPIDFDKNENRGEECSSPRLGARTRARTGMGCPNGV